MIDRLPQFPGVNAPHLATGVQPWVFFGLSSSRRVCEKYGTCFGVCQLYTSCIQVLADRESGADYRERVAQRYPPTCVSVSVMKKQSKSVGKVGKVMHEFGAGKLHSGSKKGPVVKSRKQAVAIALSEAGKSKRK